MSKVILEAKSIDKYYYDPVKYQVLFEVTLSVKEAEFVSVVGKSGCGKSTLLYLLSTMDTDYTGEIRLDGQTITGLPSKNLAHIRNKKIGFIFQFHYLLPEFHVLKNIMLPGLKLGEKSKEELEARALDLLNRLDIREQALKKPSQLSGGQKQRVAIARAMINEPLIIMGDEPTGNLDKKNSDLVFDILSNLCKENNQTMLIVTHDPDFAERTDRIIHMNDGRIVP